MTKERINMFWHGDGLSPLELACMQSFVAKGHLPCVYTYEKIALPTGVLNQDATEIMRCDDLFLFEGSASAFTNGFRYKLLLERGGWWVDTDVLCLSGNLPDCDYYWAAQEPGTINGAVLKFPAGDRLCRRLLELSRERAKNLRHWGQLGPTLLTEVIDGQTPSRHAGVTRDVYPIHWLEAHFVWFPEYRTLVRKRTDTSTFLHLWHSVLGRMGINLFSEPPVGGYLHEVYGGRKDSVLGEYDDMATRISVNTFLQQRWVRRARLKREVKRFTLGNRYMSRMHQIARKAFGGDLRS